MPAILAAFSRDEWVCVEAYTARRPSHPFWLFANWLARSRAQSNAHKVALEAVSWMTPPPVLVERNFSGKPSIGTSQSSTCVSSSVQAGLVAQSMPCTPSPDDNRSPKIDGPDALHVKRSEERRVGK